MKKLGREKEILAAVLSSFAQIRVFPCEFRAFSNERGLTELVVASPTEEMEGDVRFERRRWILRRDSEQVLFLS